MEKIYSRKNKLFYGVGDIFGGGAFLLISLLFLNYLTDVELISPALAGLVIMFGKFVDAITDPLMGYISDKTKSKFGRRRVYFLFGILPIFISFSLLWYSFNISHQYLILYYLFMYSMFSISFTIVMIPYNSILSEMINDYNDRTSFTSYRMCFCVFSAILSGILPNLIIKQFENIKIGYLVMGTCFALLYSLPWILVFLGTWERKNNIRSSGNFIKELKFTFKNRLLKIHLSLFLTAQAAVDLLTTLFIYYLTICLNRADEFSLILGTLLVMQLISMPLHSILSKRYGKTFPMKFGLVIWSCALIYSLFITSNSNSILIYIVSGICGIGTSAAIFVPWSILPEIADIDELLSGQRREGIYSGIITFIRKLSSGLVIGLLGVILDLIGYVQPEVVGQSITQRDNTILGVRILFGVVPIIFIILALFFQRKYNLNTKKHKIIVDEINRIKEEGSFITSNEVILVCEEITGFKYYEIESLRKTFSKDILESVL